MIESAHEQQTKAILQNKQLNFVRKLGKGGFGHVFLVSPSNSSGSFYAVKCLSKRKMIKDPELKQFCLQEIKTMSSLEHPNIVRLYKAFEEGDWYFLVMEYCDSGNLLNFQNKLGPKGFRLSEALNIFTQILKGVNLIHKNNIIHRDLKMDNIFIKKTNNRHLCKIGDFGFARKIDQNALTNCGTENYMAPEILLNKSYNKEVDNWALGVILFFLIFGQLPFKSINILKEIQDKCQKGFNLMENIKKKNYHFQSKKEELLVTHLFERLFEMNPEKRISLSELTDYPLFHLKDDSNSSTTEEGSDNKAVQWEVNHINYLYSILKAVETQQCLSDSLLLAYKFYLNKAIVYFLSKDQIKHFLNDEDSDEKLVHKVKALKKYAYEQLERHYHLLKDTYKKLAIPNFEDGFNFKTEDFSAFKMSYRNTIGKIYETVHQKLSESTYQRAIIKLKVFFCHIVNRVFIGNINSSTFPYLVAWMKNQGLTYQNRPYDFQLLEQWIQQQSVENLQRSQECINKVFYK